MVPGTTVAAGTRVIIKSPAGEFPITIERFEVEDGSLVIVGRMGVWDARTHVGAADFLKLTAKLVSSPAVLLYAFKAPFLAWRGKPQGAA